MINPKLRKDVCAEYLKTYSEPESLIPELKDLEKVDAVLVIPAFRESPEFINRLLRQSFSKIQKLLLVLVSNHPDDLSEKLLACALQRHSQLINALPAPSWCAEGISYHQTKGLDVLAVYKVDQNALDAKRSTGLARKIGNDIALSAIATGKSESRWIFNTDADAHLPTNYFSAAAVIDPEAAGIIYPYRHIGSEGKILAATKLYELRLHEYVEGLRSAGSPYAFHTLGSTLAISASSYAKVRGFPQRNAGEDFYLVNKLAKVGAIESLESPIIELDSRCSNRVPFGTGPAVKALSESKELLKEKIFYDPRVFDLLRLFIEAFEDKKDQSQLNRLPEEIARAAGHIGLERLFRHAEAQKLEGEQFRQHFHLWFDGFRTLKFLHYLRDTYYPNIDHETFSSYSERPR